MRESKHYSGLIHASYYPMDVVCLNAWINTFEQSRQKADLGDRGRGVGGSTSSLIDMRHRFEKSCHDCILHAPLETDQICLLASTRSALENKLKGSVNVIISCTTMQNNPITPCC
jgi:replication-associated recombination protein RarA